MAEMMTSYNNSHAESVVDGPARHAGICMRRERAVLFHAAIGIPLQNMKIWQ
jgi:hypothetical protein